MFRNAYQRGMLTIFYSAGANPFKIWDINTKNGYISRSLDPDIRSMTCDIRGTNVSTSYITCPKGNAVLGISMPFFIMVVKNLKKYFTFEVTILDDTGTRRRFRVSNFQSTTQILPLCTVMPIGLSDGWNQIQFNLAEFTRRAYKKQFVEVQKVKVNANIRLRRIYFAERLIPEDELPAEYKLFFPVPAQKSKRKKFQEAAKDEQKPAEDQQVEKKPSTEVIKAPSVHSVKKDASATSQKIEEKPPSKTLVDAGVNTENVEIEAAPAADSEKKEEEGGPTDEQEAAPVEAAEGEEKTAPAETEQGEEQITPVDAPPGEEQTAPAEAPPTEEQAAPTDAPPGEDAPTESAPAEPQATAEVAPE